MRGVIRGDEGGSREGRGLREGRDDKEGREERKDVT